MRLAGFGILERPSRLRDDRNSSTVPFYHPLGGGHSKAVGTPRPIERLDSAECAVSYRRARPRPPPPRPALNLSYLPASPPVLTPPAPYPPLPCPSRAASNRLSLAQTFRGVGDAPGVLRDQPRWHQANSVPAWQGYPGDPPSTLGTTLVPWGPPLVPRGPP